MTKRAGLGFLLLVSALAVWAAESGDFIIATANQEPVTRREMLLRAEALMAQSAGALSPTQARREALDQLILERLELQLARELKIKVSAEEVSQAENTLARRARLGLTEWREQQQRFGRDSALLQQQLRDEITIQQLISRVIDGRSQISDEEVSRAIVKLSSGTARPQRLALAQIFVPLPEKAGVAEVTAAQQQALALYEQARENRGAGFAALAAKWSQGSEGSEGGKLGERFASEWPQLFVRAVSPLAEGDIAPPVRSGSGLHILRLLKREEGFFARQWQVRHILLRITAERSREAATAQLAQMRADIESGKSDFANLARRYSDDPGSAPHGGDLGWTTEGTLVPEFENALGKQAQGEISAPFATSFGLHIAQWQQQRETEVSAEEFRRAWRARLREKKAREELVKWQQELRAGAYVDIRANALDG